jgi:hypothetical protein
MPRCRRRASNWFRRKPPATDPRKGRRGLATSASCRLYGGRCAPVRSFLVASAAGCAARPGRGPACAGTCATAGDSAGRRGRAGCSAAAGAIAVQRTGQPAGRDTDRTRRHLDRSAGRDGGRRERRHRSAPGARLRHPCAQLSRGVDRWTPDRRRSGVLDRPGQPGRPGAGRRPQHLGGALDRQGAAVRGVVLRCRRRGVPGAGAVATNRQACRPRPHRDRVAARAHGARLAGARRPRAAVPGPVRPRPLECGARHQLRRDGNRRRCRLSCRIGRAGDAGGAGRHSARPPRCRPCGAVAGAQRSCQRRRAAMADPSGGVGPCRRRAVVDRRTAAALAAAA